MSESRFGMYETGCITSIVDAVVVADGTTNCGRQADPRAGAVSSEDGEASKEGLIWSAALFGDATERDSSSRGEIGARAAASDVSSIAMGERDSLYMKSSGFRYAVRRAKSGAGEGIGADIGGVKTVAGNTGSAAADSNTGSSDSSMTNATELAVEQREIAFEG